MAKPEKEKPKTALTKPAPAGVPALVNDFASLAGAGQTSHVEDYALPFLSLIQSGSPQVKRGKAEYNEEAEPGMILNTVTGEVFDGEEGIFVVPVAFEKVFIEWKPRDTGGGLVAVHKRVTGTALELTGKRDEKNKCILPNGNILETTMQHYVLLVRENGTVDQAIIAMTSTQIKKSRKWNTMMAKIMVQANGKQFPAPSFACEYHLTTVPESNAQGDWFGWKIEYKALDANKAPVLIDSAELFHKAKAFYDAITAGAVKVSEPVPQEEEHAGKANASKVM